MFLPVDVVIEHMDVASGGLFVHELDPRGFSEWHLQPAVHSDTFVGIAAHMPLMVSRTGKERAAVGVRPRVTQPEEISERRQNGRFLFIVPVHSEKQSAKIERVGRRDREPDV